MKNEIQQVLQLIYDLFYDSGGTWPTLGQLQRTLNRRASANVDVTRIVRHIPTTLLKPLPSADAYPAASEKLVLTVEGIERCMRSGEDIDNVITAVKWLARRAERSDQPGDQSERGMRFTTRQLAEAVSLSLALDQRSLNRLVAILQAEGWVQDDDDRRDKSWTRPLRTLGNPGLPWHRGGLGLYEDQGSSAASAR